MCIRWRLSDQNIRRFVYNIRLFAISISIVHAAQSQSHSAVLQDAYGIRFDCDITHVTSITSQMSKLMRELDLPKNLVEIKRKRTKTTVSIDYQLVSDIKDSNTLDFKHRPEFQISDDKVRLPIAGGLFRTIDVVSRKEILLAMLQRGRLTTFSGAACTVAALRDQLGVRQNIVAWTSQLSWGWPDGESAFWHDKYWKRGTPLPRIKLDHALLDTFLNQDKYSIGCYTASKIAYAHAVLDYYQRVKHNHAVANIVRARLLADNDPLVDIEPSAMWSFESDFDTKARKRAGKILTLHHGVAAENFVPGDWIYILNTDKQSAERTGYEGSNAIYLGGGNFDDFYNDHQHSYTYTEKMSEVYQWRYGVHNRIRDAAKIHAIGDAKLKQLSQIPAAGGMLFDFRVTPYFFGYQTLPKL